MIDKIAAAKLNNAPIFAASCTGPASKATVAANSETVKPIAATKPMTIRSINLKPSGIPNLSGTAATQIEIYQSVFLY